MLIQRPDPGRKLQRAYGLQRMPDAILSPEIVPVALVDDLSKSPAGTERGYIGRLDITPAVGETALHSFGMPDGSDQPLLLEAIQVVSTVDARVDVSVPLANIAGINFRNTKQFTNFALPGTPTAAIGDVSLAALPARRFFAVVRILALTPTVIPLNILIWGPENRSIVVNTGSADVPLQANYFWTEIEDLG